MGEVTDPNLLRILNAGASPASGPVYGPPPKAPPAPTPLQLNADKRAADADARAAAAAARAEAEYNATHNPDGSKKAAPTDLKVIPQGSVTAIQENRHNLDMLGHSLEVLRSRPGSVGPGTGMLGDTFTQFNDPGGTEVRRAIGQIGAIKIHDLSGAAVSASEAPRFMPFVPAVTDRPDVARQKLEGFQKEMAAYLREQEGFYADPANGYLAYKGPGASPTATQAPDATPTQDDFAQNDPNGLTGSVHADPSTPPPPPSSPPSGGGGDPLSLDTIALGLKQGAGSVVQGIGDTVGIAANPIGQMLYNATGYGDQRYDAGTALREGLGLPQNPNQTADTMIRAGTGGLMFGGAARSLAELVNPGIWQNGLRVVGAQPATDAAAGVAGGYGADQARQAGYGPGVQTLAALALGAPVAGVSALANRAPRVPTPYAAAAGRQRVQMMPADAGGPMTRRVTGGLAQSPISAGPIVEAAQANQGQIAAATRRASNSEAATATTDIAGENVRAAGERYSQQTSARGGRLYDRAERAAQGVQIVPQNTIATIDQQIARLSENEGSNAALIGELQTLRADLESGASVAGMRDLRTNLRGNMAPGGALRSNQQQHMYRGIVDQLSADIEAGLTQAGRGAAARAFRTADNFWRQRVEQIDQVLQPILGRDGQRGGEEIVQAIEGMARGQSGGNRRLGRLMGNMTPEEQSNVRATVIDRLGRATPGQQTADGNAFSAATFLTNWVKMTPQAKATMFGGGELRRNLDDIAILAQGSRDAQRYANHSNTSGGNIVTGAAYLLGTGVGGLKTAATIAALQYSTARLMASPRFAGWLARMPAVQNPRALNAYIGRLGTIAAEDALIASDARGLQQRLQNSFSQSPSRAAAEDKKQN